MKSTADIADQRKHMRFRVQEGAFAVLMNHVTKVGPVKDISQGGLAFTYISEDNLPQGSFMVDLLWFLIPRPLAAGLPIRNGSRACPGV